MDELPSTHASLLLRIHDADDRPAWRQFVTVYTPLVYRYCRGRGLQDCDAADVSQDVMAAVASAIRGFDYDRKRGTFRGWLFTVTRSKLNDYFARRQRHPPATGASGVQKILSEVPSPSESDQWDRDYQRRLFEWGADKIRGEFKESTWQAFWRTAVDHQPIRETAERLELSVGAVYIARSRVLCRLKEYIQENIGEE